MMTVKVHEFVNAILISEITITQWLCLYPSDPSKTVSNMIESKTLRTLYDSLTCIYCGDIVCQNICSSIFYESSLEITFGLQEK